MVACSGTLRRACVGGPLRREAVPPVVFYVFIKRSSPLSQWSAGLFSFPVAAPAKEGQPERKLREAAEAVIAATKLPQQASKQKAI